MKEKKSGDEREMILSASLFNSI